MPQLAPAVSALARQTMRAAFEDLERTITPADALAIQSMTTVQHVRTAVLDIEKQLAARQSLRNMRRLAPLLKGLEHYGKVLDILSNGTPFLPWIWAPITLVLRVSSEYIEAFEQIMNGYSRIADALKRFEILSDAFITNHDFQQTIAVFYADILQFHKHAYKFVRRSSWKLFFLTSWGRFQRRFDNILDNLKRHGELIDQEANARDISEARQMRQDLRTWREESLDLVKRQEIERAAKQYREIMSWLKVDESEQLSIFESISEEVAKSPGTCEWIVKNSNISAWLQRKPDSPFVWLQGNPGAGKSVLSTQLVRFLQAAKSSVIWHFCTYAYVSSTKYESIVKSLLLQLLRTNGELVDYTYHECVLGQKSPALSTLEQLLQMVSQSMSDEPTETKHVWFVIDGLDECELEKQTRLLGLLNQIATKFSTNGETICKVLVSCRFSPTISKRLRGKPIVSLSDESEQVETAIQRYASQRLQSAGERLRQLEAQPEDIEEIEQTIAKKAAGMFLYARLVLDYLTTSIFMDCDELKTSVHELPPTLKEFYQKILVQILAGQDSRSVDRIRCILGWIAFARRPLKKLEFLSAFTFSTGNPKTTRLAPQYILDICSPFLEERRDTTLTFIHVSVKEFLEKSSGRIVLREQDSLREHGLASVTCLLSGLELFSDAIDKSTRFLHLIKGVHGFHMYATEFWTEYLLDAAATGGLDPSSSFFKVACQLALKLGTPGEQILNTANAADLRLQFLRQHELLCRHVENALAARSRKQLQSGIVQQQGPNGNPQPVERPLPLDGISTMLESYQQAVESILNQDSYPGVSAEELELFKSHFRTSAYTCRLRSCPRATIGFETEKLRQEHELIHAGGFRCTYAGCQYPAFRSAKSLTSHEDSFHKLKPARTSIREPRRIESGMTSTIRPFPAPQDTSRTIQAWKTTQNLNRDAEIFQGPTAGDENVSALAQESSRPGLIIGHMTEQNPIVPRPVQKRRQRPSFSENSDPKRATGVMPLSESERLAIINRNKAQLETLEREAKKVAQERAIYPQVAYPGSSTQIPEHHQNEAEATSMFTSPSMEVGGKTDTSEPISATYESDIEDRNEVHVSPKTRVDPIAPTYQGFKAYIRQLNPHIEDDLLERITRVQTMRYKSILGLKVAHLELVKQRKCGNRALCPGMGGGWRPLPLIRDVRSCLVPCAQFPSGFPQPPVPELPAEFECPFCFTITLIYSPMEWTSHVYEDFQCYTCTFPDCPEPVSSFKHKTFWLRHETEHRRLSHWRCHSTSCANGLFATKDYFVRHLRQSHAQFPFPDYLVETCRQITTKPPSEEHCPVCGAAFWSNELMDHLAEHLVGISFSILPLLEDKKIQHTFSTLRQSIEEMNPFWAKPPTENPMRSTPNSTLGNGMRPSFIEFPQNPPSSDFVKDATDSLDSSRSPYNQTPVATSNYLSYQDQLPG